MPSRTSPHSVEESVEESPEAALLRRARKQAARGDARQAMLLLREACYYTGQDAKLWTLYAVQCWRMRRFDDAAEALRQAIWLREREPNDRRSPALGKLLAAVEARRALGSLRAA